MKPQFLIGGASTGCGKTVFAMGLFRALKKRGLRVQAYKCGPDFIDPQFHSLASGHDSINLDFWFAGKTHLQYIYNKYGENSDSCIIEGNSALFDGYRRMQGSSAEMSTLLSLPVVLVVNARSSAYSVAPMLYGYKHFRPFLKIAGVVFTQVSSRVHFSYLQDACNDAGLNCLGFIPYDENLKLPSRHTAITQSVRNEIEELVEKASEYVEKNIDIDIILKVCTRIFPCRYTLPYTSDVEGMETGFVKLNNKIRIAVAKDAAFNFIYRENIDRLSSLGEITFFSPLFAKDIPEADILYIPGGFTELFARQLYRRKDFLSKLRAYADNGGKIIAEGGGVALLSKSITVREGGTAYEMSGILPIHCFLSKDGLISGYRYLALGGIRLNGYESRVLSADWLREDGITVTSRVNIMNTRGAETDTPLYRYKNVIASFTHFYWGDTDIMRLWD